MEILQAQAIVAHSGRGVYGVPQREEAIEHPLDIYVAREHVSMVPLESGAAYTGACPQIGDRAALSSGKFCARSLCAD